MAPRHTLLLVEDDPATAEPTRAALRRAAPRVRLALATGYLGALECARHLTPDLVVLDVDRPDRYGLVFLDTWRREAALSARPVVVLTRAAAGDPMLEAYRTRVSALCRRPGARAELERLMALTCRLWLEHAVTPPRGRELDG